MRAAEQTPRDDEKSQLKLLIAKGKDQGYLTYHEVNDHLPGGIVDPGQIDDIINMINDMGITVHETPPDLDILMTDSTEDPDEDAAAEAAAALISIESEFGKTTEPVRMYMREMGTVDLLTREGEIKIAKRIEDGINQVLATLASYPGTIQMLLDAHQAVLKDELKMSDIILGFNDTEEYPDSGIIPSEVTPSETDADDEEDADLGLDPEVIQEYIEQLTKLHSKYVRPGPWDRPRLPPRQPPPGAPHAERVAPRVPGACAARAPGAAGAEPRGGRLAAAPPTA